MTITQIYKQILMGSILKQGVGSPFQNICYNTHLSNLSTHQNYGDLGMFLFLIFSKTDKILKQTK